MWLAVLRTDCVCVFVGMKERERGMISWGFKRLIYNNINRPRTKKFFLKNS